MVAPHWNIIASKTPAGSQSYCTSLGKSPFRPHGKDQEDGQADIGTRLHGGSRSSYGKLSATDRHQRALRQTHYDWMRKDATYPARFAEARERATQTLEDEAVRRAVEGVRRPVLYRGKQVYIQGKPLFDIEYSDQLLIRLLEAFNPEKYGRHVEQINLMEIDPDKLTPAMLDKIADHLLKKALGENAPIAEIDRRLAAGQDVTFEEAKAIEAPKEQGKMSPPVILELR